MKKDILLFILFLLLLVQNAYGQELLSVDKDKSYVLDLTDGAKKYPLEDFFNPDNLSFFEGHKLKAYIFILKESASNPRDTYVLDLETDLKNAEWQYKIFGETTVRDGVRIIVWNNSRDHSAPSFDIELSGEVPTPAIDIIEPYYESYNLGKGPGIGRNKLAVFTIYDGEINPINKVQNVGEYGFFSTNQKINMDLEEIRKNLDTTGLAKNSADDLEQLKKYILKLGEKDGHMGLSLDLSRIFVNIKSSLPTQDNRLLIAMVIVAILVAVVTGFAGYKMGQGEKNISPDLLNQFDTSYSALKQNLDKLERIDISSLPGASDQAVQLEGIKRQIATGLASIRNRLNQLR